MTKNIFPQTFKYMRNHAKSINEYDVGMTTRQLGAWSGSSASYISQIEKDTRQPSKGVLMGLCEALTAFNNLDNGDIGSDELYKYLINILNGIKPDAFTSLKVANSLIDTNYVDFLQFPLEYPYDIDMSLSDIEIAEQVQKKWNGDEYIDDTKGLLDQYRYLDSKLLLNKADDPSTEIILDNKQLTEQEKIILNSAIKTIRDLRK